MPPIFGSFAPVDPTTPELNDLSGKYRPGIVDKLGQTWPARMGKAIFGALALPGDVYSGRTPVVDENGNTSQDVINRSADLAGTMMMGATAAPAMRDAVGAGRRTYQSGLFESAEPIKGNRGQNIQSPLGAKLESTTPSVPNNAAGKTPPMSTPKKLTWDSFDRFFAENNIPFTRSNSESISELYGPSSSRYYMIETPNGPEKVRISDHSYGNNKFDFRYGNDQASAFETILTALGRDVPTEIVELSRQTKLTHALGELDHALKNKYPKETIKFWQDKIEMLKNTSPEMSFGSLVPKEK